MSYESTAEPIRIGYLMDFKLSEDFPQHYRDDLTIPFDMVSTTPWPRASSTGPSRSFTARSEGLSKGTVKAVIDAYSELVGDGCMAIFGPHVGDNAVAIKDALNERFRVPEISVTGSDEALG